MENEERFFREIEDTLHAHEDAYVPGAWEDFRKERERRPVLLWLVLSGAAAVLLLFLMVQFFTGTTNKNDTNLAAVKKNQPGTEQLPGNSATRKQSRSDKLAADTLGTVAGNSVAMSNAGRGGVAPARRSPSARYAGKPLPQNIVKNIYPDNTTNIASVNRGDRTNNDHQPVETITNADSLAGNPATGVSPDRVIAKTEAKRYAGNSGTRSVYDSLVKAKAGNPIATVVKTNERALSYSVVLSPSLGNQKVNFGTGVEVNYKLNKNFYVSSGLAYSNLTANAGGINGSDPSHRIQGVNLAVSGFELPIGLQYRTSNGFYLSAGVLAMTVMNNHLQYNYVNDYATTVASYSLSGTVQQAIRVASEVTTEQSNEKINNYLGFYMFSVGKKKAIGKTQLNFGPFLRVPFGGVTSQNIQLMQGGIHLGLDF